MMASYALAEVIIRLRAVAIVPGSVTRDELIIEQLNESPAQCVRTCLQQIEKSQP